MPSDTDKNNSLEQNKKFIGFTWNQGRFNLV
jgi:hypothetical protein